MRADRWTPRGEGDRFKLSPILSPLQAHREDILVLTNLCNKATFGGDGHYVKTGGWLTGTTITRTTGSHIRANGVPMDQLATAAIGQETKLPSLELGTEAVARGVDKNVHYTRLYSSNIAWKTPATPLPCEANPRGAFDRLFREGSGSGHCQAAGRVSVLDVVKEDAERLRAGLGSADQHRVEEYLENVRGVERRLEMQALDQRINRWHVGQFGYLLARMKAIREGGGTLLEHSALLFGSSMRDGNDHDPRNLPLVLAGRANGHIRTGRHLVCEAETPMCNLSVSLLHAVGAPIGRIGDSTGSLSNLG